MTDRNEVRADLDDEQLDHIERRGDLTAVQLAPIFDRLKVLALDCDCARELRAKGLGDKSIAAALINETIFDYAVAAWGKERATEIKLRGQLADAAKALRRVMKATGVAEGGKTCDTMPRFHGVWRWAIEEIAEQRKLGVRKLRTPGPEYIEVEDHQAIEMIETATGNWPILADAAELALRRMEADDTLDDKTVDPAVKRTFIGGTLPAVYEAITGGIHGKTGSREGQDFVRGVLKAMGMSNTPGYVELCREEYRRDIKERRPRFVQQRPSLFRPEAQEALKERQRIYLEACERATGAPDMEKWIALELVEKERRANASIASNGAPPPVDGPTEAA